MSVLRLGELTLHYEEAGQGPPLLLLAGLASDGRSWLPVLGGLASRHRVITLDNRGAGRTLPGEGPASMRVLAEDAAALLEHLEVPRTHVLGHSMGGFAAMELARRFPERVDRLVLAGTAARISPEGRTLLQGWAAGLDGPLARREWFLDLFRGIFTPAFLRRPGVMEACLQWALEDPYPQRPEAFRQQVEAILAFDGREGLQALACPCLVIAGAEDRIFLPWECRSLAQAIPGARFRKIPRAAHAIHSEAPEAFVEAVVAFLGARSPSA